MIASNRLLSCDNCGIVVDFSNYALDREIVYNHDQDKKCKAVTCPVCKELIPSEEWEADHE
jgi:transcription initiation factor TFIIIB Brf1 subunit/transcription initiation factor TFIIB